MTGFVEIGSIEEVPVGRSKAFEVDGATIAVHHTAAGYFASDNTCPHRGGPLAQGDLLGNEIVCPWHLWGFDLTTGVCAGNPEVRIAMYEVRLEGDRIQVKLP